jgi:HK97 gp10 family phage protein
MADSFTVKLEGVGEFAAALRALPDVLRRRVVVAALRDGAREIQRIAKSNAPVLKGPARFRKAGTLRSAITVRTSKFARKSGEAGVFIGVRPLRGAREKKLGRRGATNPNDPFYWWFVELGTRPHVIKPRTGKTLAWGIGTKRGFARAVAHPGITGQKFLTRAAQSGGQQAISTAMRRVVPQIERLTVSRIKRLEREIGTTL